jgi:hypothetical protein
MEQFPHLDRNGGAVEENFVSDSDDNSLQLLDDAVSLDSYVRGGPSPSLNGEVFLIFI